MKRITTVQEFCDLYLEPSQIVWIIDFDSDYVYHVGRVEKLETEIEDKAILSARLECVREQLSLTKRKNGIGLYI